MAFGGRGPVRDGAAAGCLTVGFADGHGRRRGSCRCRRTIRSSRRSWRRRPTTCCGSSCTSSSSTAGCSRAARRARTTTRARRRSSIRSWPRRSEDLDAVLADVRDSVLAKAAEAAALRTQTLVENAEVLAGAARDAARVLRRGRQAARTRQRRLGDRRDGRRRRPAPPAAAVARAAGARPHRGVGGPHRGRQRRRRRGDLRAPGDRLRRGRATRCSRSPRAAARRT